MQKGVVITLVIVVVVAAVFLVSMYYSQPAQTETKNLPSSSTSNQVSISNFEFSQNSLTVKAGTTVVWTNNDGTSHTVTSDSGSELSSKTLSSRDTYEHTFNTPGTYTYHCAFHSSMKGTIVVQ